MAFPATFDTSSLNGTKGFNITGVTRHYFGDFVAGIGDINGDNIPDFAVSSIEANTVYIIFGGGTFPSNFQVADLDGTNGFAFKGSIDTLLGHSVAGIGDVNGDGINDFIVGTADETNESPKVYVVFGIPKGSHFPSVLLASAINGANGFVLTSPLLPHGFGYSVAGLGDINGDRRPDFAAGEPFANRAAVVFGISNTTHFPAILSISDLNGVNGFILTGEDFGLGYQIAGIGDINGDGRPDFIVTTTHGKAAYVIFGVPNTSHFPKILSTRV